MRIGQKMRRRLFALTVAMAGSFALALGVKACDGPDWVAVPLVVIGLAALGFLLALCDAISCAADRREADIDLAACRRVRRARHRLPEVAKWLPAEKPGVHE